jgi:adenosylcobinamide-GDP ribazoletransferase
MIAVSGGLHMDGLADTADGFFSSRPKERVLEIMKDSRSGPMGVLSLVCIVLLKAVLVISLPRSIRTEVLFFMPVAGRCALTMTMGLLQYVRKQEGLGALFAPGHKVFKIIISILVLFMSAWFSLRVNGLYCAGSSLLFVLCFAWYVTGKIGGYTGDTLGAACELAELIPALQIIVIIPG